MENTSIKRDFKFRNNNSFIYINNTPKILRFSKTPIMGNLDKKNLNKRVSNNEKILLKKKPYINFNFNLIQNKNMNNKKIRTITPNLKLREIVNKKFRENKYQNLNSLIKCQTELPDISNYNKIQNKSYILTEINKKKDQNENLDKQLKLVFVMKNKINELNKIIKEKNREIINLKNGELLLNNFNNFKPAEKDKNISEEKNINSISTNIKKENKTISKERENNMKIRNIKKENNNSKNKINNNKNNKNNKSLNPINKKNGDALKLNKEIENLNKIINNLDEKYRQEIKKNKEFSQRYSFIKNCTFGMGAPQMKMDDKIRNYENKIINLEEQIYEYKEKESKYNKKRNFLSEQEYSNIQICLNALLKLNNIKEENILKYINKITFDNIEKITNSICKLLNISDKTLISNFLNDYIMKNYKNIFQELTFEEIYKYNILYNYNNNNLFSFIKERCIIYDYEKKGIIPVDYLRHIYDEFCFINNKQKNEKEFFDLVCVCKKFINSNNLYDINYNNLIVKESGIKYNNNDDTNANLCKNFIDSIMNEELEKIKEREREKKLTKYLKNKDKNMKGNKIELNEDFII